MLTVCADCKRRTPRELNGNGLVAAQRSSSPPNAPQVILSISGHITLSMVYKGQPIRDKDGTGTVIIRITVRKWRGGYPRNQKAIKRGILYV